jgi:hypothetical protein
MNLLRLHWFDIGIALAIIVAIFIIISGQSGIALLLWISLISLFIHQVEEYRYPGYFPGMINKALFASDMPDRYPLNTNTALIVNVFIGWLFYFLAVLFYRDAIWLGIATMLVSVGNFFAHTFLFNIKGHTFYNPGMITAIFLFLPISTIFFLETVENNFATPTDWVIGIALGIILNYVGVLKTIDWMKDKNTLYIFPKRFV